MEQKIAFVASWGFYPTIGARSLDPKQGCSCGLQGTASAIPQPFVPVPHCFIESLCPPLQGLRVCVQGSLKNTVIAFNQARPHWIIWQVESPLNVVFFSSVLYHRTSKMSPLGALDDLRCAVGSRLVSTLMVRARFTLGTG